MFDIGLSKLMVAGVVALIVIGPEKLPRVARTAGALFGRAQRYVNEVKTEVSQQMAMDDIKKMKDSVEEAARKVQTSVSQTMTETNQSVESAWKSMDPKPAEAVGAQGEVVSVTASSEPLPSSPDLPKSFTPPKGTLTTMTPKDAPVPAFIQSQPVSLLQAHAQSKLNNQKQLTEKEHARSWRAQRSAMPLWYKRRMHVKSALLSGAAKHARQTQS